MNTPVTQQLHAEDLNVKPEDFSKICRICLSNDISENIFKLTYSNVFLTQLYEILCGVRVRNTDNLPQNICRDCIGKLVRYYDFQIKCQKIEEYLNEILLNEQLQQSNETNNTESVMLPCLEEELQSNGVYVVKRIDSDDGGNNGEKSVMLEIGETVVLSDINESAVKMEESVDFDDCGDNTQTSEMNDSSKRETIVNDNSNLPDYFCTCLEGFTNLIDLFEHCNILVHEPKVDKILLFKCSCGLYLPNNDDLIEHRNKMDHNQPTYNCIYCNNFYYSEEKLLKHLKATHEIDDFTCELCSKQFLSLENVKKHVTVHFDETPYHCFVCFEGFTDITTYKTHVYTHNINYQICEYCGNDYSTVRKYRSHIRLKHSPSELRNDRYLCEFCGKTFPLITTFNNHKRNLHSQIVYYCDKCDRKFRTRVALNSHYLTHSDVRRYYCKICKKSFRRPLDLRKHLLIHLGKKPYVCNICMRRFTQKAHLKSHTLTHTGEKPYVCKYCHREFALNGNLTVHLRLHTGERPYQCDVCASSFSATNALKKHKRRHALNNKGDRVKMESVLKDGSGDSE